jgi:hypothetical protein
MPNYKHKYIANIYSNRQQRRSNGRPDVDRASRCGEHAGDHEHTVPIVADAHSAHILLALAQTHTCKMCDSLRLLQVIVTRA